MKKEIFGIAVLLTMNCLFSFAQGPLGYIVKGELADNTNDGKMIYIRQFDDNKAIDSTLVTNKQFVFKGNVSNPSYCYIKAGQEAARFIIENGNILAQFTKGQYSSGTPMNDSLAVWLAEESDLFSMIKTKNEEFKKQYTDNKEYMSKWEEFLKPIQEKYLAKGTEKFKIHNNNALGEYLLRSNVYMPDDTEAVENLLNNLGPWLKSRSMVQKMISRFTNLKNTAEGKMLVDFKGKDMDGKEISLSDIVGKGKYVLMDMWASWCGPCKREIPNLIALQNKYKDKGFTVLGIFVWDKEPNLKVSVEKEKMTWPQIFDSESVATTLYGVEGIPNITLFAPDGTILKRGLRGENMIKTIDEIMKDK